MNLFEKMIKFKIMIKKLSQNGSLKIRKSQSCGKKKETTKLCIFGVPKKWPDQARKTRVPNTPKDETTPNPERFVSHTCVSHRLWFVHMGTGWAGSATNIISRRHSTHASTHKGMIGRTTFPPHPKEGPLPDKTPAGQNVAQ